MSHFCWVALIFIFWICKFWTLLRWIWPNFREHSGIFLSLLAYFEPFLILVCFFHHFQAHLIKIRNRTHAIWLSHQHWRPEHNSTLARKYLPFIRCTFSNCIWDVQVNNPSIFHCVPKKLSCTASGCSRLTCPKVSLKWNWNGPKMNLKMDFVVHLPFVQKKCH